MKLFAVVKLVVTLRPHEMPDRREWIKA